MSSYSVVPRSREFCLLHGILVLLTLYEKLHLLCRLFNGDQMVRLCEIFGQSSGRCQCLELWDILDALGEIWLIMDYVLQILDRGNVC